MGDGERLAFRGGGRGGRGVCEAWDAGRGDGGRLPLKCRGHGGRGVCWACEAGRGDGGRLLLEWDGHTGADAGTGAGSTKAGPVARVAKFASEKPPAKTHDMYAGDLVQRSHND
eukprot:357149-Pelagomonas_calceolata.AAC.3